MKTEYQIFGNIIYITDVQKNCKSKWVTDKYCLKHDNQGEYDVIIDEKMNLQKITTHNLY